MTPTAGNSVNTNCGEVTSSDCISVPNSLLKQLGLCQGDLTDILCTLASCCNNSSSSGTWVDFSSSIPTSGSSSGTDPGTSGSLTWSITSVTGIGNYENIFANNNPMYKITSEGDLLVRGAFSLLYTPATIRGNFYIPLCTIPPTSLAANFNASQSVLVFTNTFAALLANEQLTTTVVCWLELIYPTGQLILYTQWTDVTAPNLSYPTINNYSILLGGVRFNLA